MRLDGDRAQTLLRRDDIAFVSQAEEFMPCAS
jgi:hypothetical protein